MEPAPVSCPSIADTTTAPGTRPWPTGPTAHDNLGVLCRRHHRLKQSPYYSLRQPAPGAFRWTFPTGHVYLVTPDPQATYVGDDP